MTPRASILMPAYNNGKYLNEAIDSMLAQTFTDFELIVLDDGSIDNTQEVVTAYTDPRVVYQRSQQNLGLAHNLNIGLKMARGEFIVRMDGDDISLPNRLQVQIDYLTSHPSIDLCSCGLQKFGQEEDIWLRETDPEEVKITMMFYSPILHATSVWRKASFEKHQLYYRQEAFPAEDYDLWSRAIFHCRMVNIREVHYQYRIHGIQVTKIDTRNRLKDQEIRSVYLKKALPSFSKKDREELLQYIANRTIASSDALKSLHSIYQKLLKANEKDHFFNQKRLKIRLEKLYDHEILILLKNKSHTWQEKISLWTALSLKQQLKSILR